MASRRLLGFTLTEVLVLIGVIATLSAISWPIIFSGIRAGHVRVCSSNLKQMFLGLRSYMDENDGTSGGSPARMGLPGLHHLGKVTGKFQCPEREPITCSGGNPYLMHWPNPDIEGSDSNDFWPRYIERYQGSAILLYDNGHSDSCPITPLSLNRCLGLTLGGAVHVAIRRANPDAPDLFFNP